MRVRTFAVLALSLSTSAFAVGPLSLDEEAAASDVMTESTRTSEASEAPESTLEADQERQAKFDALHGGSADGAAVESHVDRAFYSGWMGSRRLQFNSYPGRVLGIGTFGSVDLIYSGNQVIGRSGNSRVYLTCVGNWVTGVGPRGQVNLVVNGNHVSGRVGNLNVNVSVWGRQARGTFGFDAFYLTGRRVLKISGLAPLLGAM